MPAGGSQKPPVAAAPLNVDRPIIDTLQDQLLELNTTDNVSEMVEMLNETKKVDLLVPFLISSQVSEWLKKIEVAV